MAATSFPASETGRTTGRTATYSTEARPALMTTEFWVAMVTSMLVVIAGYVDDGFSEERAWTLGTAITVAYLLSRGLAKAGSHDTLTMRDDGRRDQ